MEAGLAGAESACEGEMICDGAACGPVFDAVFHFVSQQIVHDAGVSLPALSDGFAVDLMSPTLEPTN